MDLLSSVGYVGQPLSFIDQEKFGYPTSKGIYIHDINKGPREIFWKHDKNIQTWAVNSDSNSFIVSYKNYQDQPLELIRLSDPSTPQFSFESSSDAPIINMGLTSDGTRLFGLSDIRDHALHLWQVADEQNDFGPSQFINHRASSGMVGSKSSSMPSVNNNTNVPPPGTSVPFVAPVLLAKLKLSNNYRGLAIDPSESFRCCLYSNDEILIINCFEIFKEYSLKQEKIFPFPTEPFTVPAPPPPIFLPQSQLKDIKETAPEVLITPTPIPSDFNKDQAVQFVKFLPFNRLLIFFSDGYVVDYNIETRNKIFLGKFFDPDIPTSMKLIPVSCVCTMQNIIIGLKSGGVYWFKSSGLMSETYDQNALIDSMSKPLKKIPLNSPVLSLDNDPMFTIILIGTKDGQILKAPINIEEAPQATNVEKEDELNPIAKPEEKDIKCEVAEGVNIGNDSPGGIVLCSSFLSIGVKKIHSKGKSSISGILTGSHEGVITFWRNLVSTSTNDIGIIAPGSSNGPGTSLRRSNPRNMKKILSLPTSISTPISAISTITLSNNNIILCVGYTSGMLHFWNIKAFENDEDDIRYTQTGSNSISKVIEDDDGSILVRLEAKYFFYINMFNTPINSIEILDKNSPNIEIVVSGEDQQKAYIVDIIKNGRISIGQKIKTIPIPENYGSIHTVLYFDQSVHLFSKENGIVKSNYYPELFEEAEKKEKKDRKERNKDKIQTIIPSENIPFSLCGSTVKFILANNNTYALALTTSGYIYYLILPEDPAHRESWDKIKSRKIIETNDFISSAAFSSNSQFFALGGIDGTLYIWKIDGESTRDIFLVHQLELYQHPILTITFSTDGSTLFTSCLDGTFNIISLGKNTTKARQTSIFNSLTSSFNSNDLELTEELLTDTNESLVEIRLEKEKEKYLKEHHAYQCRGISAAVEELQKRLNTLIAQNEARNDLEKLPLDEFVLDIEKKDAIILQNKNLVEKLRLTYENRIKYNELLAARIRNRTYDTNKITSVKVRPFQIIDELVPSDFEGVTSFSIPNTDPKLSKFIDKMKRLRRLELRAIRHAGKPGSINRIPATEGNFSYRSAWSPLMNGVPVDISYIVNEGILWPLNKYTPTENESSSGDKNKKSEIEDENQSNTHNANNSAPFFDEEGFFLNPDGSQVEIDDHDVLNLFYPPQAARSIIQKRNQIFFLREIIHRVKEDFNSKVAVLKNDKEEVIANVKSKNDRIREILDDLKSNERIWEPAFTNDESPENCLIVLPNEVFSKPYVSDAMKKKQAEEEEERRRKLLENEEEINKQRALVDMMHGTLEIKRDMLAEALLHQKPDWMDELLPSEMNENQLKEYEAYQLKVKQFHEEQILYRKVLEQELKKIKGEIYDLCKSFNEKIESLSSKKIKFQKNILSQELNISKISYSLFQAEQIRRYTKKLEEITAKNRKEIAEIKSFQDSSETKLNQLRNKVVSLQEEVSKLEKSFKRDLQNLCNFTFDQETLKNYIELYSKRSYPHGGPDNGETQGDMGSDIGDGSASHSASHSNSHSMASSNLRSKKSKETSRAPGMNKMNSSQSRRSGTTHKAGGGKSKLKASRGVNASSGMVGGGKESGNNSNMGPMQMAAHDIKNQESENHQAVLDKKLRDPFNQIRIIKNKLKETKERHFPLLNPLSMELDCHEGFVVDQYYWSKLQELRNMKIEKEIETKLYECEYEETLSKFSLIRYEYSKFNNISSTHKINRNLFKEKLSKIENDLDILIVLKQGQDEVDREAAATDYTVGLLIPVEVIHKLNKRIKELALEKIGILMKIKLFRRKINALKWEANHQDLEKSHYENYYTDLQLFRVTRDLQKVIIEGENAFNQKERVDKINLRKEFMIKDQHSKHFKLHDKLRTYERQLFEKENEVRALEEQIANLQKQVDMSEGIKKSREAGLNDADTITPADKMKKIVHRRRMIDLAKAQAEEIDLLHQELDKMRQKTFPSFVKATKKRIGI